MCKSRAKTEGNVKMELIKRDGKGKKSGKSVQRERG